MLISWLVGESIKNRGAVVIDTAHEGYQPATLRYGLMPVILLLSGDREARSN